MGLMLEGLDGIKADVTDDHALKVDPESGFERALKNGDAYAWSDGYNYTGVDTILALMNDSPDRDLHVMKIVIGTDTSTQFTVHAPDVCTTGTAVTEVNLNRKSANTADATCIRDETANTQANVIMEGMLLANTSQSYDVDIILGHEDVLGVDFVTTGTMGTAAFIGYFE